MRTNIYFTGRTIVTETLYKRIRKTVVLYPDNSFDVRISRNIFQVNF